MGFSPTKFRNVIRNEYHWEARKNRIILWDKHEARALLELNLKEATEAYFQLYEVLREAGVDHDLISFR